MSVVWSGIFLTQSLAAALVGAAVLTLFAATQRRRGALRPVVVDEAWQAASSGGVPERFCAADELIALVARGTPFASPPGTYPQPDVPPIARLAQQVQNRFRAVVNITRARVARR